jgi:hypothetical protein
MIAAGLLLGAAPLALAQPAGPGQGYSPDQGYGPSAYGQPQPPWTPSPPPPGAGPQGPASDAAASTYGQSQEDYQARLRQYEHEKREYDRQRAAYDAQFGGGSNAGTYGNAPPPPPPAPPAPPGEWRREAYRGSFGYNETFPFHDGPWTSDERGGRWYRDRGCRLATPRDGDGDRMIPVCPDADGRYRPA